LNLAAAALVAVLLPCGQPAGGSFAQGEHVAPGPPVAVLTLRGDPADLRARISPEPRGATLLVFWGSWCMPCIHEVPEIKEVGRFYGKRGLRVVSVALSLHEDTLEKVAQAASAHGIDYEILFDKDDAARQAFGIKSVPTSLLIDASGVVRWRGNTLPSDINERIKAALGPGEASGAQ
jgi:thiol-disulfide isomerase/thioredoxin